MKKKFAERIEYFALNELAVAMFKFSCDLLYMHHHAMGDKFDTIHSITGDLYKKAIEDLDKLSELSLAKNEAVINYALPIDSAYYRPIDFDKRALNDEVDWEFFIAALDEQGSEIINLLKHIDESLYTRDVISVIDDMVAFWDIEINYKNKRRF